MKGKLLIFSVIIGSTLLLGNILAPRLFLGSMVRSAGLKDIFIKRLEKNYPIRVTCSSVRYRGGRIELTELRINTLDKKPLLRAPLTRINFDVWRLILHPTSANHAISRLVFLSPSLYLTKDSQGHWNFEKLRKDQSKKADMDLKIAIENGSLFLPTDISGWRPGNMDRINGEVSLSRNQKVDWRIYGHTRKDEKISIKSEGSITSEDRSGNILLHIQNLSLAMAEREAPAKIKPTNWGVTGLSGDCTVDVRLNQTKNGWHWDGAVIHLDNAGARWNKMSQPISGVSGGMEISPKYIRAENLKGRIGASLVRVDGETDLTGTHPEHQINMQSNNFQIAVLSSIYPGLSAWKVQGLADIRLRLMILNKKPQLRGEIHLTDASCQGSQQKIAFSKIESLLIFNDQGIQIHHFNGYWDNTRLEATGLLKDWNDLHWDVQIKSDRVDVAPLIKSLPIKTDDLSVKTKITGPLRQPVLGWEVGTKKWAWKKLQGRDAIAAGNYDLASGLIKVETLRLGVGEAWIEGKGKIETRGSEPRFNAELSGSSLNMAEILDWIAPEAEKPSISGLASFNLSGAGRLKDWRTWEVRGTANGSGGSINALQYQGFMAKINYKEGSVHIEQLTVEQAHGKLLASGGWSPDLGLQGRVNFDQFGLHLVFPGKSARDLEGTVSGELRFAWAKNWRNLDGQGDLDVSRLRSGENELGDIHIQAKMDKNRVVHIDGSNLRLNQDESVQIDGLVDLNNTPSFDLRVHAKDVSLETLKNWVPDNALSVNGKVNGEISINGPLSDPTVIAKLSSENLRVSGHPLGDAEVDLSLKNGIVTVNDATIKQGEGRVNFNGRLSLKENDLSIKSIHYPLKGLSFMLGGVPVQGEVEFEGQLRGDLSNPMMKGELAVKDLNLAGLIFQTVNGEVVWRDRTLSAHEVVASRGKQRLILQGDLDFSKKPQINLDAKLETTKLRELMLVIGLRPGIPMDGNITGNLKLLGSLASPKIILKSELYEGFVDQYTHLNGVLDVELYEKVLFIRQLELEGPNGILKSNGIYEPEKKAEFNLDLTDFNLQPLGALLKTQDIVEGRLDLQAEIKYGASGMQGEISGRVKEGKWRNVLLPYTELNAHVRDNILSLTMNQQDIGLVLRGEGPINSQWMKSFKLPGIHVNEGAAMHWELSAPAVAGSMIEKVAPQAHFSSGKIGMQIVLDGTWQSPNIAGRIYIKQLKGKVDLLPETFNEINGEIRINGTKLEIIKFDSKYGKGRASVSGGISLRGFIPDQLNLKIHINRFYYKGAGFESTINSDFTITGSPQDPLIAGEAVINKSTISIVRSKRLKRFNPRLDIQVHSGKENYFRQVGLANILVHGDMHIGGTLTFPELLGRVNSNRGTLTLYGTTFRLREATGEFDPKNGLFPFINGQALTRKENVEITLTAKGWTNQTLEMHLESRPNMTYEEIVSLLHWTDREGGLALLQGNVNSLVNSLFGTRLNQLGNTIGLDFFDIDQERFSGPFRLNIGKSITKDLYLGYSRTLDTLGEDNWVLEYSLTSNISLLEEYTEDDGAIYQLDFHFHF